MSSVCKKDIPNIKGKVIELIHEIFGLNTNERNKNICVFKGACSISFYLFKQIFRIDDRLNIEESPIMKLNSLLEDLFQISLASNKESILLEWWLGFI